MNKHSILTKTTIFFILLFLCINALLYLYIVYLKDNAITLQGQRYFELIKMIRLNPTENEDFFKKEVKKHNVTIITNKDLKKEILQSKAILKDKIFGVHLYKNERYIKFIKLNRSIKNRFRDFVNNPKYLKLLEKSNFDRDKAMKKFLKSNRILLLPKKPTREYFIFRDDSLETQLLNKIHKYTVIFVVIINILLLSFYIFIFKKIKPLNKLRDNINKFAHGDLSISTKMKGHDEIAQVANEFDNAIGKIKELKDTRNLYLRNIMHELKTPITKGKLIADTLEESRKKEILQRAFYRLQYLLEEFTKVEELNSGKINLDIRSFNMIDLFHQALDILLLDESEFNIKDENIFINADFQLFSIALKNLIDNAIKYNTNGAPNIIITKEYIEITNQGEVLKKPIKEYFKPFNREYESIEKGLGLGLYITNNIIKKHNFTLEYKFSNKHHHFKILF